MIEGTNTRHGGNEKQDHWSDPVLAMSMMLLKCVFREMTCDCVCWVRVVEDWAVCLASIIMKMKYTCLLGIRLHLQGQWIV